MNAEATIELCGVSKRFGRVQALHDLNLSIRAGELTALLGPNGAGKTTAIELMLGLLQPTAGTVRVLGNRPQAARTQVGVMPQESALPAALTVHEVVTLFAHMYPAPLAVKEALALADLLPLAGRWRWAHAATSLRTRPHPISPVLFDRFTRAGGPSTPGWLPRRGASAIPSPSASGRCCAQRRGERALPSSRPG